MADGPGINVLEGGLHAEEEPKDSAVMRQVWRAEAERAAEYFSGLPGFGPATPDVRLTQVVQPAPAEPDSADAHPDRAGATMASAPEQEVSVPQEQEEKLPRRRILAKLRHRLGRRPRTQLAPPAASEEPVLSEEPLLAQEGPAGNTPAEESRPTRFRSSF